MRTSIDIPDALMKRLKRVAIEESTTLRQLLIEGAERRLDGVATRKKNRYVDRSVDGKGVQPGVNENDWEQTRAMIYGERL